MRFIIPLMGLAAVGRAFSADELEKANPIRRVVTLLQKMAQQIDEEEKTEKTLYDRFMCYCEGNTKGMSGEAEAAKAKILKLKAQIEEESAKKAATDEEIEEHKKDREAAKQAVASATEIRNKENEEYLKASGDQGANVAALKKAIEVLSANKGTNFLQTVGGNDLARLRKMAMLFNGDQYEKQNLMSFLDEGRTYGDYVPASGEIVGILKEMLDNMMEELGGIVEAEEKAQAAYDQLVAAKNSEIQLASQSIERKTVRSGELAVSVVQAKSDVEDTNRELGETQAFLANLSIACDEKTKEWEARQKLRGEERVAISEVIKILNDDDSLDIFKKSLPSPGRPAGVFLQKEDTKTVAQRKAFMLIHAKAVTTHQPQMKVLAFLLQQGKVNFFKVIKMIDDILVLLKQEQKDDDDHLAFCNRSLDTVSDEIKAMAGKIDDLTTAIEEDEAHIEVFTSEIATAQESIKNLDKGVAEATDQRKKENSEFTKEQSLLTSAVQLLNKAKNRLNKFYNPNAYVAPEQREPTQEEQIAMNNGEEVDLSQPPRLIEGTTQTVNFAQRSFLQLNELPPPPPETWNGGYRKKGAKAGGVTALVDMLIKDLESQLSEAKKDEENAQKEYEQMMNDSAKARAADAQSITDKTAEKADAETRLQENKVAKKISHESLQELKQEESDLHGSCDFLVENYDFRKTARAQERDALVNAKAILQGAKFD